MGKLVTLVFTPGKNPTLSLNGQHPIKCAGRLPSKQSIFTFDIRQLIDVDLAKETNKFSTLLLELAVHEMRVGLKRGITETAVYKLPIIRRKSLKIYGIDWIHIDTILSILVQGGAIIPRGSSYLKTEAFTQFLSERHVGDEKMTREDVTVSSIQKFMEDEKHYSIPHSLASYELHDLINEQERAVAMGATKKILKQLKDLISERKRQKPRRKSEFDQVMESAKREEEESKESKKNKTKKKVTMHKEGKDIYYEGEVTS